MKPPIKITVTGDAGAALLADALHCLNGSQHPNNLSAVARIFGECEINTEWIDTRPKTPEPVLVPLGPNVTRNGREVRVICTDVKNATRPVRYLIVDPAQGKEIVRSCDKYGLHYIDKTPSNNDLVGHLPPEPVKPLEVWIKTTSGVARDSLCILKPADADERGYRLFREVLPGADDDELDSLRRWKADATVVINRLPFDEIGRELGLRAGDKISEHILPKIKEYKRLLEQTLNYVSGPLAQEIVKALKP